MSFFQPLRTSEESILFLDRRTAQGTEQPAMRHVGQNRRELFKEIERAALKPLPAAPFEYAAWKLAKVHPDYHVRPEK